MNLNAPSSPDHILDTRGLMCPEPIRLAQLASRELAHGQVLEVLATDMAAPIDFEAWCAGQGHRYVGDHTEQTWLVIRVQIRRPQAPA